MVGRPVHDAVDANPTALPRRNARSSGASGRSSVARSWSSCACQGGDRTSRTSPPAPDVWCVQERWHSGL